MSLPTFTLNDETVRTSHGFYLLNAGGRFDRFISNSVMLDNHDDNRLLGKWVGLKVDGPLLLAEPEFDEGTELGRERKGQVERGYLKGASIGLYIKAAEYRANPSTGIAELYVTEWEMLEASVTPLPSNAGALTLKIYDAENRQIPDGEVALHLDNIVKLSLNNSQDQMPNNQNTTGVSTPVAVTLTATALVALNLNEDAPASAISAAVVKLAADYAHEKSEREKLQQTIEAERQKQADALVDLAISEGRITADKKDAFVKLALSDYEAAQAAIAAIPAKQSLSAKVTGVAGNGTIPAERQTWNLHRWMKEDMPGLNKLKAEEPETYAAILKRV